MSQRLFSSVTLACNAITFNQHLTHYTSNGLNVGPKITLPLEVIPANLKNDVLKLTFLGCFSNTVSHCFSEILKPGD